VHVYRPTEVMYKEDEDTRVIASDNK